MVLEVQNEATGSARKPGSELNGQHLPVQYEFWQPRIGLHMKPSRGTGPLLEKCVDTAKKALKKAKTLPAGFNDDHGSNLEWGRTRGHVATDEVFETAVPYSLWAPSRPCRSKEIIFTSPTTEWQHQWQSRIDDSAS